jgi:transposase
VTSFFARFKSGINLVLDTDLARLMYLAFFTTESRRTVMESFYMGIDVSKGYADFVIIDARKRPVIKNFQLDDTFEGHSSLFEILRRFMNNHPKAALYAAVESTGGYENNWYKALLKFHSEINIRTARLNPLGVTHNSKADLQRNKTDKISAQNVAEYLIAHPEKVAYQKEDPLTGLKKQWNFIQMLKKQCTQFRNQLQALLYTINPEILACCRNGFPEWVLTLLLQYPSASKLGNAQATALAKIPFITHDRAEILIADARKSVASDEDPVSEQLATVTSTQILHLEKTIKDQEKRLFEQCRDIDDVKLLLTFTGIGNASSAGLYIEIGAIERFKSASRLSSFWGVHPIYKQSGDGSGSFKMSKQGRKNPRIILYQVAMTAIVHNPLIRELYEYHVHQGRAKMDALGICMHKIVRVIYGMLKNKTAFDPAVDKANRNRSLPDITKAPKKMTDRRFQNYDSKAPVSRRQSKRRMERAQSQGVSNDTKCGIRKPVPVKDILTDILLNINQT